MSAHLTALREAGLLKTRRQGHELVYLRTQLGDALAGDAGAPGGDPGDGIPGAGLRA